MGYIQESLADPFNKSDAYLIRRIARITAARKLKIIFEADNIKVFVIILVKKADLTTILKFSNPTQGLLIPSMIL